MIYGPGGIFRMVRNRQVIHMQGTSVELRPLEHGKEPPRYISTVTVNTEWWGIVQ